MTDTIISVSQPIMTPDIEIFLLKSVLEFIAEENNEAFSDL